MTKTLRRRIQEEVRTILEGRGYPFVGDLDKEIAGRAMELVLESRNKRKMGDDKHFFALALSLAKVCRVDFNVNQKLLIALARQLDKPPSDVEKYYGVGAWWYANDFRGKKGQPPKPNQVCETWGQWKTDVRRVASAKTVNADGSFNL